jgi:hypothetical protein
MLKVFRNCTACGAVGLGVCVCAIGNAIIKPAAERGEPRDARLYAQLQPPD